MDQDGPGLYLDLDLSLTMIPLGNLDLGHLMVP